MGNAQILCLPAGHRAVQLGKSEEAGTAVVGVDLGSLTLGLQAALAHPAVAAGDVEGDDHPVSGHEVRYFGAHFLDDAHGFVAQHVAGLHVRPEHFIEMKIGAADRGRGDLDDGVGRFLQNRVRDPLYADRPFSLPGECLHVRSFTSTVWKC